MLSRRRFMQAGAVAASLGTRALAQGTDAPCATLPSPLASLKSMKDQAQPITN
jgi:hypothetical protein